MKKNIGIMSIVCLLVIQNFGFAMVGERKAARSRDMGDVSKKYIRDIRKLGLEEDPIVQAILAGDHTAFSRLFVKKDIYSHRGIYRSGYKDDNRFTYIWIALDRLPLPDKKDTKEYVQQFTIFKDLVENSRALLLKKNWAQYSDGTLMECTLLHVAAIRNDEQLVRLLLENCPDLWKTGDVHILDDDGKSAADYARRHGHKAAAILRLLGQMPITDEKTDQDIKTEDTDKSKQPNKERCCSRDKKHGFCVIL